MSNPVVSPLSSWLPDSTGADQNTPQGSSSMLPGSNTELAGELRVIKSNVRALSLDLQWETWDGQYGTLTYVSASSFNLTGDQRVSSGGPVQSARAIRAHVGSGFVYAYILSDVFSGGITTVTLNAPVLDPTLAQVDFGVSTIEASGLAGAPFAQVSRSSNQTLTSGVITILSFDTVLDTNAGTRVFNIATPDRLLIPETGLYTFAGQATFDANATGVRGIGFDFDGSVTLKFGVQEVGATTTGQLRIATCVQAYCAAGRYIQFGAFQNSGGNLDVVASTFTPGFSACYLSGAKKTPTS